MKYLGIDWGLKKIGLAVSEGELASPLGSFKIKGLREGVEKVGRLVKLEGIELIVIGKPEGEMGKEVERVASLLQQRGISTTLVDETLSTQQAKELMLKMGKGRKARRDDNTTAAAVILQNFLDEQRR